MWGFFPLPWFASAVWAFTVHMARSYLEGLKALAYWLNNNFFCYEVMDKWYLTEREAKPIRRVVAIEAFRFDPRHISLTVRPIELFSDNDPDFIFFHFSILTISGWSRCIVTIFCGNGLEPIL